MLTQRNIRKSSLLLIYALEMQHTNPKDIRDFPLENYWGLVNEHAKKKYAGMLAKAVLHESRSLAELLDAMRARAGEFETYAAGHDTTAAAAASTHALLKELEDVPRVMRSLRRLLEEEGNEREREQLPEQTGRLIGACERICRFAEEHLPLLERETHESVTAFAGALRRVKKAAEGCAALRCPEQLPSNSEHANIIGLAKEMRERRPLTEKLALEVYSRCEEWERHLQNLLRNYVPSRLNAIDRCILYISFYDLLCRKLDPGIVISEACILADEYSGGKSAPFIHGVIATAIMQLMPDTNQPER